MRRARNTGAQLLLWAAPLGVALAAALLFSQARWFRAGPDVPSAGDGRAWAAMWGAIALLAVGCAVGGVAAVVWLIGAWRRGHRPSALEWFRTGLNLLLALGGCWLWFRS